LINDPAIESNAKSQPMSEAMSDKVTVSIEIDSELMEQVSHLTNNPSKVIEVALRQWLGGGRQDDDLSRPIRRNPPVPPKGEWND
jgi:hypothetical protein